MEKNFKDAFVQANTETCSSENEEYRCLTPVYNIRIRKKTVQKSLRKIYESQLLSPKITRNSEISKPKSIERIIEVNSIIPISKSRRFLKRQKKPQFFPKLSPFFNTKTSLFATLPKHF